MKVSYTVCSQNVALPEKLLGAVLESYVFIYLGVMGSARRSDDII